MSNPLKTFVQRRGSRRAMVPLREDPYLKSSPEQMEKFDQLWNRHSEQVSRLNLAYLETWLYLNRKDRKLCHAMIVTALAATLDLPDAGGTPNVLGKAADDACTLLKERAEQTGRKRYAIGLYLGVGYSLVLLVAIGLVVRGQTQIPADTMAGLRDVLVCIGGGAAGAVISTIIRVSAAKEIDYKVVTLRTAAFRIALGWLFAAALLCLLKSGIVTVFTVPSSAPFYFWGGVGVLAGFNEAWARNLITRTEPAKK